MISIKSRTVSFPIFFATILLLGLFVNGCYQQEDRSNQRRIFVGPNLVDCVGEAPQKCMLVKNKPEDDWSLYYSQIEGFDFEEGYEYELIVELEAIENPPQDGPMVRTRLVEIISKAEEISPVSEKNTISHKLPLLSWETLQNSTYLIPISPGGIARMASGEYTETLPASLGGNLEVRLSPYRYYGELDSDSLEDTVVFLLIKQGDKPTSTYLVGVLNQGETALPLAPQELGDGVFVRDGVIKDGQIFLDLDFMDDTGPVCCPIESKRLVFNLVGENLQKVDESALVDSRSIVPPDKMNPIIQIKPGDDEKIINGNLVPHLIEVHPLHGLAGQILDVAVSTLHNDAVLSIVGLEDGVVLLGAGAGSTRWSGEMPSTQDYALKVIPVGGEAEYTLHAAIKATGGRTLVIPPEPYLVPSAENTVDVYSGPGMGFKLIGMLGTGEAIQIKGKNQGVTPETKWWQVCCFGSQDGWVRDDFVEVVGSTDELPVPENGSIGTPEPVEPEQPPSTDMEKIVFLSFDVGAEEFQITDEILKALVKFDAAGTFFLESSVLEDQKDLVQKILAGGNRIALLSSNRSEPLTLNQDNQADDEQRFWEALTTEESKCLRPGLMNSDAISRAIAAEMGLKTLFWDIDAQDWKIKDPEEIADRVIDQITPNAVVLMQGSGKELVSAEALEKILTFLKEQDFHFGLLCLE